MKISPSFEFHEIMDRLQTKTCSQVKSWPLFMLFCNIIGFISLLRSYLVFPTSYPFPSSQAFEFREQLLAKEHEIEEWEQVYEPLGCGICGTLFEYWKVSIRFKEVPFPCHLQLWWLQFWHWRPLCSLWTTWPSPGRLLLPSPCWPLLWWPSHCWFHRFLLPFFNSQPFSTFSMLNNIFHFKQTTYYRHSN